MAKRTFWYDRQRVDRSDLIEDQDFHMGRYQGGLDIVLGKGVVNGLEISSDIYIMNQESGILENTIISDGIDRLLFQTFKATDDNIQRVEIMLETDFGSAGGFIEVGIYTLADPTDPTSAIGSLIGAVSINAIIVQTVPILIPFDFSTVPAIRNPASLTVGSYYAVRIRRTDVSGGKIINVRYANTNAYVDGIVKEYDGSVFTDRPTLDLRMNIQSAAIQVSAGSAYVNGKPITIQAAVRNVSLVNTIGGQNYIALKYLAVNTDQETNQQLGNLEWSRIEDSYEIEVLSSDPGFSSEYIILATVVSGPVVVTDLRSYLPQQSSGYMSAITLDQTRGAIDITNNSILNGINISNTNIGSGIDIVNSSTGKGIDITNSASGEGVEISNSSTGSGIKINNTSTGNGVDISSSSGFGISIGITGSSEGIRINSSASDSALEIRNNSGSGDGLSIVNNTSTTGLGLNLQNLSTNNLGMLISSSADNSRGLVIEGFPGASFGHGRLLDLVPKSNDSDCDAALRIQSQLTPTSLGNGDIWFDGSAIKIRISGVTRTFTVT